MDSSLPSVKFLPGKSFILSVLLHILVFNVLILVWPTLPEARKPHFNFLGSILSASDVMIPLAVTEREGGPTLNYQFQDTSSSLFDPRLSKPIDHRQHSPEEKRTVKEIANESEIPSPKEHINPKDTRIDLDIEPYKPLRLKTND